VPGRRHQGFTLIELVVVIVILGILAIVAAPKFLSVSTEARIAVIAQLQASVKEANQLVYLKSKMPSYSVQAVSGRPDLTDVDLDGNGTYETRLKCGYLDNTDVAKRLDYSSDELKSQEEGVDKIYLGYIRGSNTTVKASNCYFMYGQAYGATNPSSCNTEDTAHAATYATVTSGC